MKSRHAKNKENDKIARLKIAHKRVFFQNLKTICNLFAGADLFSSFSVGLLDKIYAMRMRNPIVLAGEGISLSKQDMDSLATVIKYFNESCFIDLPNGKGKISLALQLVEGLTLQYNIQHIDEGGFPELKKIKEALAYFAGEEFFGLYYDKVNLMLNCTSILISDFKQGIFWLQHKFGMKHDVKVFFYINRAKPEIDHFFIEGQNRPAYRVGWCFAGGQHIWSEVTPQQIGKNNIGLNTPMPVYIQNHALVRLDERVNQMRGIMHLNVFDSVKKCEYHYDEHGRLFIAYYFFEKKLGYLVCSVEQERLLIHTFLFLTNNGTPEGKLVV